MSDSAQDQTNQGVQLEAFGGPSPETRATLVRDYVLSLQREKAAKADPSVVDLVGEAGYSAIYSGAQAPAIGLAQLVDRGFETKWAKAVDRLPAPEADFGSSRWHAQQIGGALGMVLPFAATRGSLKATGLSLAARTEATVAVSGRLLSAAKGASVVDAALTGFVYDFTMTPVAANERDFWAARRAHGYTGAATFGTLAAGSLALRHATRVAGSELGGVRKVAYDVTTGALPGIPAGVVNADVGTRLTQGRWATAEERIKGAYTMTMVGGAVTGLHLLPGQEITRETSAREKNSAGKTELERMLAERAKAAVEAVRDVVPSPEGLTDVSSRLTRMGSGSASHAMMRGRALASHDVEVNTADIAGEGRVPVKDRIGPDTRAVRRAVVVDKITQQHLGEFQEILEKPFRDNQGLNGQIRDWNNAVLRADGFVHNHRSIVLEDAIKDWAQQQSNPQIKQFVDWVYDGKRSEARRSNYLMDLAFAEGKALGVDTYEMMQLGYARGNMQKGVKERGITEKQNSATVETLLRLMEDGQDPRNPDAKIVPGSLERQAALQMLMQAGEPTRVVQFNHPTCGLGALEVDMYSRNPDVVTKAVSDVLRTGKLTTSDGTEIVIDRESLRAERGSGVYGHQYFRSYASEVFQTLASNVYWQRQTVAPDGRTVPAGSLRYILRVQPNGDTVGYIMDYSGPNPRRFESGGYTQDQLHDIGNQIAPQAAPRFVPHYNDVDSLTRFLTRIRGDDPANFPRIVLVDAKHLDHKIQQADPAWHFLTVTAAFNVAGMSSRPVDGVHVHNTWELQTHPKIMTVRQLWEAQRAK